MTRVSVLKSLSIVAGALALSASAETYWVDAKNGKDTNNGLARECAEGAVGPKKTLAAVAALAQSSGDVIYALPGVYDEGEMPPTGESDATTCTNRVVLAKGVTLESTDGAEKTIIVGKASPNPIMYGCGPGAIRCAYLYANAKIKGFTLTGGRTQQVAKNNGDYGGAVACKLNGGSAIYDCIVTNNAGTRAGAMFAGEAFRCRFANNGATEICMTFRYTSAYNSVIESDYGSSYSIWGGVFYNCTFGRNEGNTRALTRNNSSGREKFYNCIILHAKLCNDSGGANEFNRCLLATDVVNVSTAQTNDCIFATEQDVGFNAYGVPCVTSPTIDAGDETYLVSQATSGGDLFGRPRSQNGRVDIGAVERTPGLTVFGGRGGATVSVEGHWTSNTTGIVYVDSVSCAAAKVTIKADETAEREMAGLVLNGESYRFADCTNGVSCLLSDFGTYADATVKYGWFVSPDGNDSDAGWSRATAFATLQYAVTNAQIAAGDIVVVMPGTYNTGSMTVSGRHTAARVVVPAGVTLQAAGSVADTRIVGARSQEPIDARTGVGPGAISCVYLKRDAAVVGFTLEGGATYATALDSGEYGGGVYSEDRYLGTIVDCVITNCAAVRGGGMANSVAYRCIFTGNRGSGLAIATNYSRAYDCVFADNTSDSGGANAYVTINTTTLNCTFLPQTDNQMYSHHFVSGAVAGDSTNWVRQTVILCRARAAAYHSQCLFASDEASGYNAKLTDAQVGDGSRLLKTDDIGVNPKTGAVRRSTAAAVDFADLAWYDPANRATDVFGRPRVQKGMIDCGAAEYDWAGRKGLTLVVW